MQSLTLSYTILMLCAKFCTEVAIVNVYRGGNAAVPQGKCKGDV